MIAFDSNILIYGAGIVRVSDDVSKVAVARELLSTLRGNELVLPVQALGEFVNVWRKTRRPIEELRREIDDLSANMTLLASTEHTAAAAFNLMFDHHFQTWDALIVAASALKGARFLLSEDMQHGFAWRGITIVNPLRDPLEAVVARLLDV